MKAIALVSILGIVLADLIGAISTSSVDGPMTMLFLFVLAILAVGVHDAWSNGRGVLGWIVSVVVVVLGGFVAVALAGLAVESILPLLHLEGSLATSNHLMRYILPAAAMALTLAGSWGALRLVRRFR
jgi:hypothetical protein